MSILVHKMSINWNQMRKKSIQKYWYFKEKELIKKKRLNFYLASSNLYCVIQTQNVTTRASIDLWFTRNGIAKMALEFSQWQRIDRRSHFHYTILFVIQMYKIVYTNKNVHENNTIFLLWNIFSPNNCSLSVRLRLEHCVNVIQSFTHTNTSAKYPMSQVYQIEIRACFVVNVCNNGVFVFHFSSNKK